MNIKIVRRPIGEAPDWVRDAWIGVSLPLAIKQRRVWRGLGVISGPTSALAQIWALARGKSVRIDGYAVRAKLAVDLLEKSQPKAAQWWRQQAPGLLTGSRCFVFNAAACEMMQQVE